MLLGQVVADARFCTRIEQIGGGGVGEVAASQARGDGAFCTHVEAHRWSPKCPAKASREAGSIGIYIESLVRGNAVADGDAKL